MLVLICLVFLSLNVPLAFAGADDTYYNEFFAEAGKDSWNEQAVQGFRDRMLVAYWISRGVYITNGLWSHFAKSSVGGSEDSYVDLADLAFFSGHGNDGFFTTRDGKYVYANQLKIGDKDIEWFGMTACYTHKTPLSWLEGFGPGIHLLPGYTTLATANYNFGYYWAHHILSDMTIRQAWNRVTQDYQNSGTTARVIGAYVSRDDKLSSYSADPVSNASPYYSYWDYTK